MAERASIFQVVHVGKETSPGTGVTCNRKLQSMAFVPQIAAETTPFRPSGHKFPTIVRIPVMFISSKDLKPLVLLQGVILLNHAFNNFRPI